ncbi:MAG: TolC family protein, partial [Candidatus Caldarchaeum sp.]
EIARKNLKAQEHSAKLTRERFEGGFASGLDVANAEALVATTAAQIPILEASARQSIYNLSVLLGSEPGALLEELSHASAIPIAPPPVPVGVPSDLLRRRPDIRRAEVQIHAATARIGVATADLFPKFTISSTVGFQAGGIGSLLSWANRFWSIGASFLWRIFDTASVFYNIELQKALREQEIIAYKRTILTALQEVENALIAAAKEEERKSALQRAVEANRRAVRLATELYTEGQTDFLSVLDAQRSLYSSEDSLVQSAGNLSINLISLYKALGGGWDSHQEERGNLVRN